MRRVLSSHGAGQEHPAQPRSRPRSGRVGSKPATDLRVLVFEYALNGGSYRRSRLFRDASDGREDPRRVAAPGEHWKRFVRYDDLGRRLGGDGRPHALRALARCGCDLIWVLPRDGEQDVQRVPMRRLLLLLPKQPNKSRRRALLSRNVETAPPDDDRVEPLRRVQSRRDLSARSVHDFPHSLAPRRQLCGVRQQKV